MFAALVTSPDVAPACRTEVARRNPVRRFGRDPERRKTESNVASRDVTGAVWIRPATQDNFCLFSTACTLDLSPVFRSQDMEIDRLLPWTGSC